MSIVGSNHRLNRLYSSLATIDVAPLISLGVAEQIAISLTGVAHWSTSVLKIQISSYSSIRESKFAAQSVGLFSTIAELVTWS